MLANKITLAIFSLLFLFFLSGSSNNQGDNGNERFTISNYTVFAPGSDVSINLYSNSRNDETFHFRLFKITEPEKFAFQSDRNRLRRNFDIWGSEGNSLLKYVKLVREWNASVNTSYRWGHNQNLNIGKIDEPGSYILQALRNNQVAYCGISVSNYAMIYKSGTNEILAYVVNSKSGDIIKNTNFELFTDNKLVEKKQSGKNGIAVLGLNDSTIMKSRQPLLLAKTKEEVIFSDPYFYITPKINSYLAYIYTNQPVYRPGQTVYFKAILREKTGNTLNNVKDADFTVKIKSPKNKEIFSKVIKTDEFGSLFNSIKLDDDADLGTYQIQLIKDNRYYYGSFDVEEYKKPEYLVTVKTDSSNYSYGDTLMAVVSADYYFGSPVANGKVSVKIFKQLYWRPWWYFSNYSWFYRSIQMPRFENYGKRELIKEQTGYLSAEGKYNFGYKIPPEQNGDYIYIIYADVTDNSRSTVSGSAQVNVTRGSFNLSTSPERYFVSEGTPVNLKVNASDFSDKPVETKFTIVVNYPPKGVNQNYYQPPNDTLYGSTDKFGSAEVTFIPRSSISGHYNYMVIAHDKKGREISARNSFFIGTWKQYFYGYGGPNPKIITDKDTYEKGDTVKAYVFIPDSNTDVLVTYESNNILGYEIKRVEGNTFTIKENLGEKFSPSFHIAVTYMKDRRLITADKIIGVLDKDKFLNVSIKPSKESYKPGEEANYKIEVTKNNGKPAANTELSFGVIDESIYAIKEDQTPDIKNFFYAPHYNYVPTYNSLQNNYSNGTSRYATVIDKNLIEKNVSPEGSGNLTGKIKTKAGRINYSGIYILLNGNSYFYKTGVDTSGYYSLKKIKKGNYDLLVLLGDGEFLFEKRLYVGSNSMFDINLENYENLFPMPIRFGGMGEDRVPRSGIQLMEANASNFIALKKEASTNNEFVKPEVRKNFVDAVIWKPDIITNSNGEADISFKMPDNLTTWRATVRGITKNTEVGQAINKVITRKNLLIRIETPRFFRQGDELTVSTIVHNYLSEEKHVKISFNSKDLELLNSKINQQGYNSNLHGSSHKYYEINLKKNSEVRIDWNVKVKAVPDSAKVFAEALTNEESDAVELKVPVLPYGIKKIEPVVADLSGLNEDKPVEFNIPQNADLKSAKFAFSVTPSLAGTILKALDDLVGYPYGCVEQTMSRFLPTIIVANTFKDINAPLNAETIKELPKMVHAGLKRLYNFQHNDGGWGWWTNDQTNPYMTAYVIYGMSLAEKAGYKVDSTVYKKGIKNLTEQIKNSSNDNFTTQAYMLYSLSSAVKNDTAVNIDKYVSSLNKEKLNPYALSLLALTINNMDVRAKLSEILNKLKKSAEQGASFAYWGGKAWHYSWQDDKVQTTAFAVKALLLNGKDNRLITEAVRWLLRQKQGFSWQSTQQTATVIFALTDYLKTTKELNPDFKVTVLLNNKKILERNFTQADVYKNEPVINLNNFKNNNLKEGNNRVKIIKSGPGKLYFSGRVEYFTKDLAPSPDKNIFSITRTYYLLVPENRGNKIVYVEHKFNGKITSGQYLFVKTHVECKDNGLQYFILEDMLPSGFEAVKDEKNFEIAGENNYSNYNRLRIIPWHWFYADKEYHDNKVSFFVTNINSSMDFSYIIQAQLPGSYTVMPSQGYLMYYPEVAANCSPEKIKVEDSNIR